MDASALLSHLEYILEGGGRREGSGTRKRDIKPVHLTPGTWRLKVSTWIATLLFLHSVRGGGGGEGGGEGGGGGDKILMRMWSMSVT